MVGAIGSQAFNNSLNIQKPKNVLQPSGSHATGGQNSSVNGSVNGSSQGNAGSRQQSVTLSVSASGVPADNNVDNSVNFIQQIMQQFMRKNAALPNPNTLQGNSGRLNVLA